MVYMTPYEEHMDFEAGAEDLEYRAMRHEAERDAEREARYDDEAEALIADFNDPRR